MFLHEIMTQTLKDKAIRLFDWLVPVMCNTYCTFNKLNIFKKFQHLHGMCCCLLDLGAAE